MNYLKHLSTFSILYLTIGFHCVPQSALAIPPEKCAMCEIESKGPAHSSSQVVLDAIPKVEDIQTACPGVISESPLLISPFFVRNYARYRTQLGLLFGSEVDRIAPFTTLYGSYFVHEVNSAEPVLIVNYLAFRSTPWAERVRNGMAKNPSTERYVASNGRYMVIVMRTSHSKSDSCYNGVKSLFAKKLTEASKSTLKDDSTSSLLRNILFVGGTILDTTETLTKEQLRALRPYRKSLFSLSSVEKLTANGSTDVSYFSNLEQLSLGPTPLSDADTMAIGNLKNLRIALLGGNAINDKMIAKLSGLATLEELSIRNNPITSDGMKSLSRLKLLLTLGLSDTNIDDEATSIISEFPSLEYLFLDRTKITDEGIKKLSKLKNLLFLSLIDCKVTDAAVDALASMPLLKTVIVRGTSISEAGRAKLKSIRGNHLQVD